MGLKIKRTTFTMSKIILFTYIITGISLFILAFLMYKMDLVDKQVNLGIIIIMILSTFIGGFLAGKSFKQRKFIYGAGVGVLYFFILFIISLLLHDNLKVASEGVTMFFMCLGGGTLGGMLG